jgi:hypothetical protein
MAERSTSHPTGCNLSFYPGDVLDGVIAAGRGLPDDDREVEVLTDIDPDGHPVYERAKRREALRLCLEGAAKQHRRALGGGAAPTTARLAKRYAAIESAAQKSIKALGKRSQPGSKPDRIDTTIHSELGLELAGGVPSLEAVSGWRVQKLVENMEELLRCAARVRKKYDMKPSATKCHSGDVALNDLIRWLGHAWFVVFENLPGTSQHDGIVQGPFIDFVSAALEPLVEEVPTPKALRARIRRVLPSLRSSARMAKSE